MNLSNFLRNSPDQAIGHVSKRLLTKRLVESQAIANQSIGWEPSDCLTKHLDVNQAIASLFKRLFPFQAIASV